MITAYGFQNPAAFFTPRRFAPAKPLSLFSGGLADKADQRSAKASTYDSFNLKKLGATPTTRAVVYGALGIGAVAETVAWCSWLWLKKVEPADRIDDEKLS